ncbi:hypothetical protein [Hymenobacter ruricola]|uniref:Uncharacterized protein n=1 Tax=Hymenobacter ruricola TaxID=2791023 RepID=A0ABS0I248_9BACT|nr:hypothetical protein [Hymenobacter ruricola]MBF9221026.1 hypothetical protein [Hymenobacter ruricola]
MKVLLNLKHWQLFALQLGPSLVAHFFLFGTLQSGASMRFAFVMFAVEMLFFAGTLFGWLYAVATGLHDALPAGVSLHLKRFKTALFIPVFYIAAILTYLLSGVGAGALGGHVGLIALLVVPLHLFSMASILYCLYFTAKSLKAVELQRPLDLSDYLGELFLIWFFPIGVWLIQPRVNALFKATPLASTRSNSEQTGV